MILFLFYCSVMSHWLISFNLIVIVVFSFLFFFSTRLLIRPQDINRTGLLGWLLLCFFFQCSPNSRQFTPWSSFFWDLLLLSTYTVPHIMLLLWHLNLPAERGSRVHKCNKAGTLKSPLVWPNESVTQNFRRYSDALTDYLAIFP